MRNTTGVFVAQIGWNWCGGHVFPTRQRDLPHITQNNGVTANCKPTFHAVSFLDLAINIRDRSIYHRWPFFFGAMWRKRCMLISLKELNILKRKYSALLVKYSHFYAKTLFKISTKEQPCARGFVVAICLMLYFTFNQNFFLWLNKNVW